MFRNDFLHRNFVLSIIIILSISSVTMMILNSHTSANQPSDSKLVSTAIDMQKSHSQGQTITKNNMNTVLDKISNSFFIKNMGQLGVANINYYYRTMGFQVNFLPSEIQFLEQSSVGTEIIRFSLHFPGSNLVIPIGIDPLSRVNNYFIGTSNFANVPLYNGILYKNIYDRIDLQYYFNDQGLKYDFIVHAGANPAQIQVSTSSNTALSTNSDSLTVTDLKTKTQLLQDNNLFVYQEINSEIKIIQSSFSLNSANGNFFTYSIGSFDATHDLVIDPVLVVNTSTYIGGAGANEALDFVRDSSGNFYITGTTESDNFTTKNALYPTYNAYQDIFIIKLNPTGTDIIWATYFGGNDDDQANKIALDTNNNVIIAGYSLSTDLPLKNSQNSGLNNGTNDNSFGDALVASFSSDGQTLNFCSLFGGQDDEEALGLYITPATSDYYITGYTVSTDYSTTVGAYNTTFNNNFDGFFLKMSNTGNIEYSSFLGGNKSEGDDIYVDNNGNMYILGAVVDNITNLANNGIGRDVYILKLASDYKTPIYSKLLGGNFTDTPVSFVVKNNEVYLTGFTSSSNFPTTFILGQDEYFKNSFVMKLNSTGGIDYSILIGLNGDSTTTKIAVDDNNQVTIAGYTNASNLEQVNEIDSRKNGLNGFIVTFNTQGTGITYSSYLGGSLLDNINSFILGSNNEIYLIGSTNSRDYPVNNALKSSILIGESDGFFTILSPDYTVPSLTVKTDFSFNVNTTGNNMTFIASDNDALATYTIYKNNELIVTGLLVEATQSFSVDNLEVGTYNYTVSLQDRTGHEVSKTTIITVVNPNASSFGLIDILIFLVIILSVLGIAGYYGLTKMNKKKNKTVSQSTTVLKSEPSSPESANSITETESNSMRPEEKTDS